MVQGLDQLVKEFTEVRRRLHTIPELGFEEFKTAELIRAQLRKLGIPFETGPNSAPTATIALLGHPSKPCVALRADIDALPISEATGLSYASTHPGRMHACGHDGHTANLLATGAAIEREILSLGVCVKLIFQPAEEGGGGAGRLVEAGVLDGRFAGPAVSEIYGLHGWPGLPIGVVSTKPGPLMASTDSLDVTVRGRGCHGAFPHLGVDPILAASETIVSLQGFVSREMDPTDAAVVTVGTLHAGTATNVIPDLAQFGATVRTLNDRTRKLAKTSLCRRVQGIAAAHGCTAEIEWEQGYPATINDVEAAARVTNVARALSGGPTRFFPTPSPVMGGEDFAYYLEKVPGAFFFVGVKPDGTETYPSLHSDRFDFVDGAMATGVEMFFGLVRNFASRFAE